MDSAPDPVAVDPLLRRVLESLQLRPPLDEHDVRLDQTGLGLAVDVLSKHEGERELKGKTA